MTLLFLIHFLSQDIFRVQVYCLPISVVLYHRLPDTFRHTFRRVVTVVDTFLFQLMQIGIEMPVVREELYNAMGQLSIISANPRCNFVYYSGHFLLTFFRCFVLEPSVVKVVTDDFLEAECYLVPLFQYVQNVSWGAVKVLRVFLTSNVMTTTAFYDI